MSALRRVASFIRWRLVPVRYLTRLFGIKLRDIGPKTIVKTRVCGLVLDSGYCQGPEIKSDLISKAEEIYRPRTNNVVETKTGHPFVNIFKEEDIEPENPIIQLAFSPVVFDVAADYFHGNFIIDSIQVLYSYSTQGEIRESQFWHLDYGDRKSFHAIVYLDDVEGPEDGPFVFVDKKVSRRVGRSFIVRRISDEDFSGRVKEKEIEQFLGPRGSMIYVDPAACYHYGSRCSKSRLAVFVTFSSRFPFVPPVALIHKNRAQLLRCAELIRPDLNSALLASALRVR